MNNPIDHKRLTSLDIKIAAAKRRAAAERATVAPNPQPTEGLTSLRSTKEKDVPLVHGNASKNLPEIGVAYRSMPVVRILELPDGEDILQAITQLSGQDTELHDNFSHASRLWEDAAMALKAALEAEQPRTIMVDVRHENTGRSLGDRLTSK